MFISGVVRSACRVHPDCVLLGQPEVEYDLHAPLERFHTGLPARGGVPVPMGHTPAFELMEPVGYQTGIIGKTEGAWPVGAAVWWLRRQA